MSALTERSREIAYEMFASGETSERVASRIRRPLGTVRALRANWTRNLPAARRRHLATTNTVGNVVTVRLNSTRIKNALASGQSVQLVIEG